MIEPTFVPGHDTVTSPLPLESITAVQGYFVPVMWPPSKAPLQQSTVTLKPCPWVVCVIICGELPAFTT